jgi:hypothetical protein
VFIQEFPARKPKYAQRCRHRMAVKSREPARPIGIMAPQRSRRHHRELGYSGAASGGLRAGLYGRVKRVMDFNSAICFSRPSDRRVGGYICPQRTGAGLEFHFVRANATCPLIYDGKTKILVEGTNHHSQRTRWERVTGAMLIG